MIVLNTPKKIYCKEYNEFSVIFSLYFRKSVNDCSTKRSVSDDDKKGKSKISVDKKKVP
jgi:hypothetical protein